MAGTASRTGRGVTSGTVPGAVSGTGAVSGITSGAGWSCTAPGSGAAFSTIRRRPLAVSAGARMNRSP